MMPQITTDIACAVARLRAGELLGLPTETVYGLAADARNPAAVAQVFALKGRPASNPLIVHVTGREQVDDWAASVPEAAEKLIAAFWPGPLTLVLPAKDSVSPVITAGQASVALRAPAHPSAQAVLAAFAGALVAPSANRYMSISPTCAAHVAQQFADADLLIVDGGACQVGLESTIVSLLDDTPRLLRSGTLDPAAIEHVLGQPLARGAAGSVRVPGQHVKHYAPNTPAFSVANVPVAAQADPRCGWLLLRPRDDIAGTVHALGNEPIAYARGLYAALYALDNAGLERIYIELPPRSEAWTAVHDRLSRASQSA
ncbi:L-threonylcarbamoyladenylate synthase [Atopomonas sediminilitoris]|uniref:L-threonylcarbamoyladenylate synthase n=1 Tax=Atopomonas sediminilitoris TaxID=2919919 RepID=UPI001F4D9F96|nr:L-threonylcarbamoyladenylate synthase [Atopomonas sediminilitoris]MCJ8169512.1 L-threonylcarbamoyladenylate synthase [Atopomonas sediminilitoris]